MVNSYTTKVHNKVVLTGLDLVCTPHPAAPQFKVDKVTIDFSRGLEDEKTTSHVNMYGYKVDENGEKVGRYTRVRRHGNPRPDEVQELVVQEQAVFEDQVAEAFGSNSDDEGPQPSDAEAAELSARFETAVFGDADEEDEEDDADQEDDEEE